MTKYDEFFDSLDPDKAGGSSSKSVNLDAVATRRGALEPEDENDGSALYDIGASVVGKGALSLLDAALGWGELTGSLTALRDAGYAAEPDFLRKAKDSVKAASRAVDESMSSKARRQKQAISDADGAVATAGAIFDNPYGAALMALESTAQLAVGRGAGGVVRGSVAKQIGEEALARGTARASSLGLTGEAAKSYATNYAGQVINRVASKGVKRAAAASEAAIVPGSIASSISDEYNERGEVAEAGDMAKALLGLPMGYATGRIASPETIGLTSKSASKQATGLVARGKRILGEGAQNVAEESLQGGLEQMITNWGTGDELTKDVGKSAVLEGILGGGMGAAIQTSAEARDALRFRPRANENRSLIGDANATAEQQAAGKAGVIGADELIDEKENAALQEAALNAEQEQKLAEDGYEALSADHDTAIKGGIPMIESVEQAKAIHEDPTQMGATPDYIYNDVTQQQEEALRHEQAVKAQQEAEKKAAIEKEKAEKQAAKEAAAKAKQAAKEAEKAAKEAPTAFSKRSSELGYVSTNSTSKTAKANAKAYDNASQEERDFVELAISEILADPGELGELTDARIAELFTEAKGAQLAGGKTAAIKSFINKRGAATGKGARAKNKFTNRLKDVASKIADSDTGVQEYIKGNIAKRNQEDKKATTAAEKLAEGLSFAIEPEVENRTSSPDFDEKGEYKGTGLTVSSAYKNALKNPYAPGQKAHYSDALTVDDIEKHVNALASGKLSDLDAYPDKLETEAVKAYTTSIRKRDKPEYAVTEEVITQATKHGAKYKSLDNVLGNMAAKVSRESLGMAYNRLREKVGDKPSPVAKHALDYLRAKLEMKKTPTATDELNQAFNPPVKETADKDVLQYFGAPMKSIGSNDTTQERLIDALNAERDSSSRDTEPYSEEEIASANERTAKYMRSANATYKAIDSGDYALMVSNKGDSNYGRTDASGTQSPLFAIVKRKTGADNARRAEKTGWKVFSYNNGMAVTKEDAADTFMMYARQQIRNVGKKLDSAIDEELMTAELVGMSETAIDRAFGNADEDVDNLDREYGKGDTAFNRGNEADLSQASNEDGEESSSLAKGYEFGSFLSVKTAGKDQTAGDGYIAKIIKSVGKLEEMLNTPELKSTGKDDSGTAKTTRKLAPTLDEVIKQAEKALDDAFTYYFYTTYKNRADQNNADEVRKDRNAPKGKFREFFETAADKRTLMGFFTGFINNPSFDELYKPEHGDKYPVAKAQTAEGSVRLGTLGEVANQFGEMLNYSARDAKERATIAEALVHHFETAYLVKQAPQEFMSMQQLDESASKAFFKYERARFEAGNAMLSKMKTTFRNGLRVGMSKTKMPMSWRAQDSAGKAYGVSEGGGAFTDNAMVNWGRFVRDKFEAEFPGSTIVSTPLADRIELYKKLLASEKLTLRYDKRFSPTMPNGAFHFHEGGSFASNGNKVSDFVASDLWLPNWVAASGLFTQEEINVSALLATGKQISGDERVGSKDLGKLMTKAVEEHGTRAYGIQDEQVADVEFDRWADMSGRALGSISTDQADALLQRQAARAKGSWHTHMTKLKGALSRVIAPSKLNTITQQLEANVASWTDIRAAQLLFEWEAAGRVSDIRGENAMRVFELSGADTEAIKQGGDEALENERKRLEEYLAFESEVFQSYYMDNVSADAAMEFDKVHKDVNEELEQLALVRFIALMSNVVDMEANKWADAMHSRNAALAVRAAKASELANSKAIDDINNIAGDLALSNVEDASLGGQLQEALTSKEAAQARKQMSHIKKTSKGNDAKTTAYKKANEIVNDILQGLYTSQGILSAERTIKWALSNHIGDLMAMTAAERAYTRRYMAALYKALLGNAVVRGMLSKGAANRLATKTTANSSAFKGVIESRLASLAEYHPVWLSETLDDVHEIGHVASSKYYRGLSAVAKERVIASMQDDMRHKGGVVAEEAFANRNARYNLVKIDLANLRQKIHQLFQQAVESFATRVHGTPLEKLAANENTRMYSRAAFREQGMKAGEEMPKPLKLSDFLGFIRNPMNAMGVDSSSEMASVYGLGKQIKAAESRGVYKQRASNSVYHSKGIKYGVTDILKRVLPPKERLTFIRDYVSNPNKATRAVPLNELGGENVNNSKDNALTRAVYAAIDTFHEQEKQQANRRLPNGRAFAVESKSKKIPKVVRSQKAILDYAKNPGKRLDEMDERNPNRVVVEQAKLRLIAAGMTEEAADEFFSDIVFRERHPEDNAAGSIAQHDNGLQVILQESFISIGKRLFYCTHELAHKLFGDMSAFNRGEAACQRPEMQFRIADGKLEAVGETAQQLLALAKKFPVLQRLCQYPLAADLTSAPYNDPAYVGKELLAQIGAVYLHHPAYAAVINREAPLVGKLIREYINKQNGGPDGNPGTKRSTDEGADAGSSAGTSYALDSQDVKYEGSGDVSGDGDRTSPSPNGSSDGQSTTSERNRDAGLGSELGSDGAGRASGEVTAFAMEPTPASRAVDSAVHNAVVPSKAANLVDAAIARLPEGLQGYAKKVANVLKGLRSDTLSQLLLGSSFTENLAKSVEKSMPAVKAWVATRMEKEAWQNMQLEGLARFKNRAAGFSEEVRTQANSVIEQATLTRAWPYRPSWMDDAAWRKQTTDKEARQAHLEVKAKFDALPEEAQQYIKDMFEQTHSFHKNRVDAMEAQTEQTFKQAMEGAIGDAKETLREHYEHAKRMINSFRSKGDWPYAPLDRQGTHAVVARSTEYQDALNERDELYARMKENPDKFSAADTIKLRKLNKKIDELAMDGNHYMVRFVNSQAEANLLRDEYMASHPGMTAQAFPRLEAQKSQRLSLLNLGLIEDALYKRLDHSESEGDQRKYITQMLTALNEVYINSLAEDHARKTDLRRKNVEGYNKDMINNFLNQGKREIHYVANIKFAKDLRNARNEMITQAQHAKEQDARERNQRVVRELLRREELDFEYRPSDFVDALQRFNSVWMLMLSPGYYLQNATQSFMMSAPLMCGEYEPNRVFRDLAHNTMELAKAFLNKDYRLGDSPDFRKMKFMDKDCYLALQKARANNRIDVGMAQDFGDLDKDNIWKRITDYLGNFSRTAELLNRVAAFKTAFELRREDCLNHGWTREDANKEAYRYADEILRESHGNYGASNEPRFFKRNGTPLGNAGKLVFQFRKFQLIQLGMMTRLSTAALADVETIQDEAKRAVARRALANVMGVHLAMTGLKGTPFAMFALSFLSLFGAEGDDDEDMIRKFIGNKEISDLLLEGLPSLIGLDLSGRLGAANMMSPFPFLSANPLDGRAEASEALVATLGPTASQGIKMLEGVGLLMDGELQKGFEKLAPTALANMSKAWRYSMEGYTTKNGTIAIPADEFSAMDSFMQVVGFPTKLTTDKFRLQSKLTRTEAEFQKEENRINKEFRAARGNDAKRRRIQREYVELQKRRAAAGFTPKAVTQLIKNENKVLKDQKNAKYGLIVDSTERGWLDIWSKL